MKKERTKKGFISATLNKEVSSTQIDFYGVKKNIVKRGISVRGYKKGATITIREVENKPSTMNVYGKLIETPHTWNLAHLTLNKEELKDLIKVLKEIESEAE